MVAPLVAAAAIQGGIGLAQTLGGLFKKKPKRPKYNIPQEVFENMSDAEYYAFVGLPEEQKSQALNNMREQSTRALYEANTRKAGLGTITQLAGAEQKGIIEMAVQDSTARMKNIDRLQMARTEVANQREKKFQSQLGRYQEKKQARDKLIGAGLQNIVKAGATLASGKDGMKKDTSNSINSISPSLGGESYLSQVDQNFSNLNSVNQ